jgi:hypothetical protein
MFCMFRRERQASYPNAGRHGESAGMNLSFHLPFTLYLYLLRRQKVFQYLAFLVSSTVIYCYRFGLRPVFNLSVSL